MAKASPDKRSEVFISATSGDLRSVRSLIKEGLLTIGCYPVEQTNFPPDYRSVLEMLEEKISGCDAVIHVVGVRYGAEPEAATLPADAPRRSYTQLEADMARRLGKKLYLFYCPEDFPFDEEPNAEPEEKRNLQRAYRAEVAADSRLRNKIVSREDVVRQVRELRVEMERLHAAVSNQRKRVAALAIAGVLGLAAVGAGVFYWVPQVIEESQAIDDEALRGIYRRYIEKAYADKRAEAEARGAAWRELEELKKARDQQLAEIDHSVETIRKAFAEDEASPVYRNAITVLNREGPAEMLAFLRHRGGDIRATVEEQKARRDREEKALREALRPWLLEADALEKQFEWDGAMAKYEEIVEAAPRWTEPAIKLAILLRRRGGVVEPDLGNRYLSRAAELYRTVAEEAAGAGDIHLVAQTLNNEAIVLNEQGLRSEGESSRRLIGLSIEAYQRALKSLERDEFPGLWATVQNNLGVALRDLSNRVEGEAGLILLTEAREAFFHALEVRTREDFPDDWASTQHNLGLLYIDQAILVGGQAAREALTRAKECFGHSLEIMTREDSPAEWGTVQNSLGIALLNLGRTAEDRDERHRLLKEAEETFRKALGVRTREDSPQPWAATQLNLGSTLVEQAYKSDDEEGRRLLTEAVEALQESLTVRTRETLPQDWSQVQNKRADALMLLARRLEGEESRRTLEKAEAACRQALEVRTREALPRSWADTSNTLATVLIDMADLSADGEKRQLLREAAGIFRESMEVRTREEMPVSWARTQSTLGWALWKLGLELEGDAREALLEDAAEAYRNSLEVRTLEALPRDWETSQSRLCRVLLDLGTTAAAKRKREIFREMETRLRELRSAFPDEPGYHTRITHLYHDLLYQPADAFADHEAWLRTHPDDFPTKLDFAETHFTTGRFEECITRARELQTRMNEQGEFARQASMGLIEILALAGNGQNAEALERLDILIEFVEGQESDFTFHWTWGGTRHFVENTDAPGIASQRALLLALIDAASENTRDRIVQEMRALNAPSLAD